MEYKIITDFIHDLYGGGNFIPLAVPVFIGNEKKYLNECINTTFVPSIDEFVKALFHILVLLKKFFNPHNI